MTPVVALALGAALSLLLALVPVAAAGTFGVAYGSFTVDANTHIALLPGELMCDSAGAVVVIDVAVQQGVMPGDPTEWRTADEAVASHDCRDRDMSFELSFAGLHPGRAHFQACVIEYRARFSEGAYPDYSVDCSPAQWLVLTPH